MNKSASLIIILLSIAFAKTTFANQEFYLRPADLPNRVVELTNTSTSKVVLDLKRNYSKSVDDQTTGAGYPKTFTVTSEESYLTKTGILNDDGMYSLERTLTNFQTLAKRNDGSEIALPDGKERFIGATLLGDINKEGDLKIYDLINDDFSDSEKDQFLQNVRYLPNLNEPVPTVPLKVGDSFSVPMAIVLPLPLEKSIDFQMTVFYTLTKIEAGIAHFDIEMDFAVQGYKSDNTIGQSSGFMQYNIESQIQEIEELSWIIEYEKEEGNDIFYTIMSVESVMTQNLLQ